MTVLAGRANGRWRHRLVSFALDTWWQEHSRLVKLFDLAQRVVSRLNSCRLCVSMESWRSQVLRTQATCTYFARNRRRAIHKAFSAWDHYADLMSSSEGRCKTCGRNLPGARQVWDDSLFASHLKSDGTWEKALDEHARIEKELWEEHLDLQRQLESEMADAQRKAEEDQLNSSYPKSQGSWSLSLSQANGLEVSAAPPRSQYKTMSMLGFKYNSSTLKIESLDIMGSAYQDGRVRMHDQLLAVDQEAVDTENVESLLRGKDIPGSSVLLTLFDAETAQVKHVQLTRMATTMIMEGSLDFSNSESNINAYDSSVLQAIDLRKCATAENGESRMMM